jgi:hypothetical protein
MPPQTQTTTTTASPSFDAGAQGVQGGQSGLRGQLRGQGYAGGTSMLAPGTTTQTDEEREKARVQAAQASWEALLGQSLGTKLFGLIREHVSLDDLLEYAKKGTSAMGDALEKGPAKPTGEGEALGLLDTEAEAKALNTFLAAIAPALEEASNQWLEGQSGLEVRTAISQWTEEHPTAVLLAIGTAAIGAAVAAWLTNMDPPELSKTFKLGDRWSVGGGVDLGPIQKLAVQAASLQVAYAGDKVKGSLKAGYESDTETLPDGQTRQLHTVDAAGELAYGETLTLLVKGAVTTADGVVTAKSTSGHLKLIDPKTGSTWSLGADGSRKADGTGEEGLKLEAGTKAGATTEAKLTLDGRRVRLIGEDGQIVTTDKGSVHLVVGTDAAKLDATVTASSDGSRSASLVSSYSWSDLTELTGKGDATLLADGTTTLSVGAGFRSALRNTPFSLNLDHQKNTGENPMNRWGGNLTLGGPDHQYDLGGHFDRATDTFQLKSLQSFDDGAFRYGETATQGPNGASLERSVDWKAAPLWALSMSETQSQDGNSQRFSVDKDAGKNGGLGFDMGLQTGKNRSLDLGVDYKRDQLTAALDLAMKEGQSTLGLSSTWTPGGHTTVHGNTKLDLDSGRLLELGARLGYQDPDEFKGFMLDYQRTWLTDNAQYKDHFGALFEYSVGRVEARLKGGVDVQDGRWTQQDYDMLGGYRINQDWRVLAGAEYSRTRAPGSHQTTDQLQLKSGVQYKDIGFVLKMDPNREMGKNLTIGIEIPLGRIFGK